jgi:LuxR family maltose regulon positive regulatory protein
VHDDRKAVAGGPVIVITKLRPPTLRSGTLPRESVQARLEGVDLPRLTLIAAPAGFGKTTVLATWVHRRGSGRPLAWVSLDAGDNDPAVLWSHVIAALKAALPGLGTTADPGAAGTAPLTESVLPRLTNDLATSSRVELVLDDVHRVTGDAARSSLTWALEHMPDNVHVVMASRTEPRLPLAAMRARGDLVELRLDDLRFDDLEATELLNARLGLGLDPADIRTLVRRTEGWPAGLYLAALSLRNAPDRSAFVNSFGASNRHVLDYLVDEVLLAYPPDLQDLMMGAAILEEFSGASCDAILRRKNSAGDLRELARTNLFLVPLDDRDESYRFHHLFGQLLQVELQRRAPELVLELHRRASRWNLSHGALRAAIDHALSAGELASAAELITSCWPDFANAGQYETTLSWLDQFPAPVLDSDVGLLLTKAWVLSLCGRRDDAARVLVAVDDLAPHPVGALADGFASIESSLTTLRALLPWGDVGRQLLDARRACELEEPESHWYPCAAWSVAAALYYQGETADADAWFDEAFTRAVVTAQWIVASSSLAYRSMIAGVSGRLGDQRVLAHQAAELAAGCGLEDVVGEVHSALGLALLADRDPEGALPLLARGVTVMRAWGQPTELIRSLLDLASALTSTLQLAAATAALDEAVSIADSCVDLGALPERIAAIATSVNMIALGRHNLTDREVEIVELLRDKLSEREIADRLFISFNTVHTHVRSIYRKLGAESRSDAVERAVRVGALTAYLT